MHALGHALGGEAAARLANVLGLRTVGINVVRNRRLGRCTRWAMPSVVRRLPG
ncbi:hypothetical protein D8I24_2262 (plasmid) [Cupriavidus necator H850]|nr:hypothetical protein D8I24_2262 [Cupriavidus necator H850]